MPDVWQPDLFMVEPQEFNAELLQNEIAEAYAVGNAAAAREGLALSRLALGSKRTDLSETDRWRKILRDPKRRLTPRAPIAEQERADLFIASDYVCVVCRQHKDNATLQVGHLLARAEAMILTHITGDGRPWYLAATRREDWIPECSKCNFGHHDLSYSPAAALTLLFRSATRPRNLEGSIVLEILEWLRRAEEWRP